jgi:hypothetical protein
MDIKFKEQSLRDIIISENLVIILIQETKLEEINMLEIEKKQWKNNANTTNRDRGASNGICTLWENSMFEFKFVQNTQHWILTCLAHQDTCL